jgi:hypothetical protein
MPLTLVVPGLLDLSSAALTAVDSHAAALARLIASAGRGADEQDGLLASACRACGIVKQHDWPVAPRLARAGGVDPGDAYWLCAVPVSLAVGAGDVRLASLVDDLSSEESDALIAALNAHFVSDRIAFLAAKPASWYVRAAQAQELTTRPPEAALGAPLFDFLPSGPDSARWRRWQSEVQMLLFEHAVNRGREQAGRTLVNSVWFWGGGIDAPRRTSAPLFARDAQVIELARGSGAECLALPAHFDALSRSDGAVWLDTVRPEDAAPRLEAIDREWMAPVERALASGRLSALELVAGGRARAHRFLPRRSSLAQRWRAWMSPPRCSQLLAGIAGEPALP